MAPSSKLTPRSRTTIQSRSSRFPAAPLKAGEKWRRAHAHRHAHQSRGLECRVDLGFSGSATLGADYSAAAPSDDDSSRQHRRECYPHRAQRFDLRTGRDDCHRRGRIDLGVRERYTASHRDHHRRRLAAEMCTVPVASSSASEAAGNVTVVVTVSPKVPLIRSFSVHYRRHLDERRSYRGVLRHW